MRFASFPGSTAPLGRGLAASFTLWLASAAAAADPHVGEFDPLRSRAAGTVSLQQAENVVGNASTGMSPAAGQWILRRLGTVTPGIGGGFDVTTPQATDVPARHNFARSHGYAIPNPATYPVSRSAPERIPSGQPPQGNQVLVASPSSPTGTPGMPSIGLVAEVVLEGGEIATLAGNASDQVVARGFRGDGATDAWGAAALDFKLVERLVVRSGNPELDIAATANPFALDIGDATGRSVFGPFLGADLSVPRMLSTAAEGPRMARVW